MLTKHIFLLAVKAAIHLERLKIKGSQNLRASMLCLQGLPNAPMMSSYHPHQADGARPAVPPPPGFIPATSLSPMVPESEDAANDLSAAYHHVSIPHTHPGPGQRC
jgi:hypothetical protein